MFCWNATADPYIWLALNPTNSGRLKMDSNKFKHIVRIVNTDLDGNKAISVALMKIKGIGFSFANMVCNFAKISKSKKTGMLKQEEIQKIEDILKNPAKYGAPDWMMNKRRELITGEDKHVLAAELDFAKTTDFRRLQKIKSYRGLRLSWGLPVRGQRTKSNFRRNKGKGLGVKRKKK